MNLNDKIREYLNGDLSPEDRIAFEEALQHDEALQTEVDGAKLGMMMGEASFEEEIRGLIDEEMDSKKEEESGENKEVNNRTDKKNNRVWLIILIIVSFLLGAKMYTGYEVEKESKSYEVALASYTPPQVTFIRSANSESLDSFEVAKEYFSKKEFSKSRLILEQLSFKGDDKDYKLWLLANIYFIEGDIDQSINSLNQINDPAVFIEFEEFKRLVLTIER